VAQGKIFEDDVVVVTESQGDRTQQQENQFEHGLILSRVADEINRSRADKILANDRHGGF